MGRKPKKAVAKTTNVKKDNVKKTKTIGSDLLGGIIAATGLLLLVFLSFNNMGVIASAIKDIGKGLFSSVVYLFPVMLILIGGYVIISENTVNCIKEIKKSFIVLVIFAAILYVFTQSNFNMFDNFIKFSVNVYNQGAAGIIGSSFVGALIASILVKLIGIIGTKVLLILVAIICVLYFLNMSLKQLFYGIYNIFAYFGNLIYSIYSTLFRKDEIETISSDIEVKSSRRKASKIKAEEGIKNTDENLKMAALDQVEFDFSKLGGKPSEKEIQAKQVRDDFFKKQKEEKEDKTVKEVLTLDHTRHVEDENYVFPEVNLLSENPDLNARVDEKSIKNTAIKLQKTLASFGVDAKVTNITRGPTVTRYELSPSAGVKVSKIVNLADDIALNLAAKSIRIEAPIPGKAAVGIEVPNTKTEAVFLREVIESNTFKDSKSAVSYALGKDAAGDIVVGNIAKMPHMLIAGSTGSGKSVCINALIVSILYKSKPSDVKFILIDPKMVELSGYNGIPHLLIPVVTDPKKAAGALNWAVQEMVNRYNLFAARGVKDITGYNKSIELEEGSETVKLPQIVIIIDELADLMMVAPNDVEDAICRLAQMARAAGMHLVVATQRPSVDVITGIIKANIPSRIAFTVSSQIDSRTILDMAGAEKLLGKGDMLYYPVGENKPLRIQGAFISEKEIESIVESIKENTNINYDEEIMETIEKTVLKGSGKGGSKASSDSEEAMDEGDELLNQAIDLVIDMGQASASMLQRRFKIGYSRAGRIIDQMEERGLISGYDGSKPRQVLISKAEWQELKLSVNEIQMGNNIDEEKKGE